MKSRAHTADKHAPLSRIQCSAPFPFPFLLPPSTHKPSCIATVEQLGPDEAAVSKRSTTWIMQLRLHMRGFFSISSAFLLASCFPLLLWHSSTLSPSLTLFNSSSHLKHSHPFHFISCLPSKKNQKKLQVSRVLLHDALRAPLTFSPLLLTAPTDPFLSSYVCLDIAHTLLSELLLSYKCGCSGGVGFS